MKKVYILSTVAALAANLAVFADGDNDADNPSNSTVPVVSVNASDPTAFRGLSSGAFLLHRDRTNGDLAVSIKLSGTASNGVDYATIPSPITIPAGFFSVGVPVNPLGAGASAPDEWVTLTIDTNVNYQIGKPGHAQVTIKGNVFEDQAPTVSITSPVDSTSIPAHSNLPITAEADDGNDSVKRVSFYAGDHFLGSLTSKPYSLTWSNVPPGTFALFARAEDEFGKSTLSAAVHVMATNPPSSTSTITLTQPGAGNSFPAGANITLAADVNGGAPVKTVSFYSGDTLLGSDDTAPYTFPWNNVPPGHYTLRAKVTGTDNSVASSAAVKITVSNAPPTVKITAPADKAVVGGPSDLAITAAPEDTDGTVANVTFYGDAKKLGTVTASPYTVNWTNVPPGKHLIVATATDNWGAMSSTAIMVTVTNPLPTIKITAPADKATFTAPANVEIDADASDADGIQYVSFWSGDHLLGVDKTNPYTFSLSSLRAGTYVIRAHAVDAFNQVTVSDPVTITVTGTTE